MSKEKIALVDKDDNEIGVIYRDDLKPNDIHRIVSIWIENEDGDILLAQRAMHKTLHPGLWGPAAAGAVSYGETYEEAAYKELSEEIGIADARLEYITKSLYNINGENRFISWHKTTLDKPAEEFILEDAVAQVKWFKKADLIEQLNSSPELFVPSHVLWPNLFLV